MGNLTIHLVCQAFLLAFYMYMYLNLLLQRNNGHTIQPCHLELYRTETNWDISGFEIGRLQSLSHFDLILIFEIMMFEITNLNFILRQYKQIAKLWYPVFKITSIYRLCFICKQQILTETHTPFFLNWECMYMY